MKTSPDCMSSWETLAVDPTKTHTTFAYQWWSIWGLLYNKYPDKLFKLGLVDAITYNMQSEWYSRVTKEFRYPLDNRSPYTKNYRELWALATTSLSIGRFFICNIA